MTPQIFSQSSFFTKTFPLKDSNMSICKMYEQGLSTYKIAQSFGVCQATIYNRLKSLGISLRQGKGCVLAPHKDDIIALYQNKVPMSEISRQFNCSCQTIQGLLEREGIPKTKSCFKRESKFESSVGLIEKFYQDGLTYKEIAKKVGATQSGIFSFIKKQGWKRSKVSNKSALWNKKDVIIQLYTKDFLNKTEIARRIGCSAQTITKILDQQKILPQKDLWEARLKKLYDQGLSYYEIERETGFEVSNLSHFIRKRGWTRQRKRKTTYTTKFSSKTELVVQLYKQHKTITEIAKEIGCASPICRRILLKAGVI